MERGSDTHVCLRTGHKELANAEPRQGLLKIGIFKCVAIPFFDNRFSRRRGKLGHDLPRIAAWLEVLVGVPDPNDRHLLNAGPFNQPVDGGEYFVASIRFRDDAILNIDNDKSGVRAIS